MADATDQGGCDSPNCGCALPRRGFLQLTGVGALGLLLRNLPAMAGPFETADFQRMVPEDKKLSPQWIKSLFERGEPTVYRGADLKYIGMPVGGITTGQLYLGGDGKLWHWDIFNQILHTGADHYAHPVEPESPLEQGFSLSVGDGTAAKSRRLDVRGFDDISFRGQYPIGTVEYRDATSPVAVTLEAFSPFVPLDVDDSSLPVTVLQFTLKNTSAQRVEAELTGYLENAVGIYSDQQHQYVRKNEIARQGTRLLLVNCFAEAPAPAGAQPSRETIVFEDFEGADYGKWTVEGTAFGKGPAKGAATPENLSGYLGKSLVNSWAASSSDEPQGKLISPEFEIERNYINFLIAGGNHPGETCINLIVDGKVMQTATGKNSHELEWASWDVHGEQGKTAHIEIVDHHSGAWGHIDIDQIEFADVSRNQGSIYEQPDFGTLTIGLLDPTDADRGIEVTSINDVDGAPAEQKADNAPAQNAKPIGAIVRKISLDPGAAHTATFVIAWCFPNLRLDGVRGGAGRYYATRFKSSAAAAGYLAENFERLVSTTRLWRDTFYDSTLPFWFLDRTHQSISVLATSTAHRFANGRFYGWEGVGCCEGTCTHVWQYEQGMGRLFPELDRLLRDWADFNPQIGMNPDGMIDHRGEFHAGEAIDGQAGTILRAYRDHQTSIDNAFLKKNYPSIKKAMQWLITQDGLDGVEDGILRGAQHNTLDVEWYGPVAWLSGLYLASLRATEEMANEAGDQEFAAHCRKIFEVGRVKFVELLFNGEYFINLPDPKHLDAINSGSGCEIDQVMGQSWAFQVGLGRVMPEKETRSALHSLWKYNFSPDVGVYRKVNKPGRWYAMPGEAGLLICTFPRPDWNYDKASGKGPQWAAGYFNECQNGYEHEVAGHMIWEGLLLEGLAVERAIHDRYHASRRNPWNEVECGDHYARSMASYGLFIAACGFAYHGPKGHLAFAPRLTPGNFKAAFTSAQGWGAYSQQSDQAGHKAQLEIKWGRLRLNTLRLKLPDAMLPKTVAVVLDGKAIDTKHTIADGDVTITLAAEITIEKDQRLELAIS
jgi:non-lysosomal glucosylceramidase